MEENKAKADIPLTTSEKIGVAMFVPVFLVFIIVIFVQLLLFIVPDYDSTTKLPSL